MEPKTLAAKLMETWPARMAQDAWSAFKAPGNAYSSTPDNPVTTEQMIKPAADLAGLMTLGAGAAPAEANAVGMGIRAYHGSPHDFDRFDLSKIGTGEGAQVYGHGLYFAENPATAKAYQEALAGQAHRSSPVGRAYDLLRAGHSPEEIYSGMMDMARRAPSPELREEFRRSATAAIDGSTHNYKPQGHMYEVEINADPARMLPWDEAVQSDMLAAVRPLVPSDKLQSFDHQGRVGVSGAQVYQDFLGGKLHRTKPLASASLNEAGVPGIKYLDQGSRASGDGSRNYVVFDDKLVNILKKFGIAGLGVPGLAAGVPVSSSQEQ